MNRRAFLGSTAWWGVSMIAGRSPATSAPCQIRGRVLCADEGLAGVRCSDGRHVVLTDRQGCFTIRSNGDAGPFVFVVLPQGYWTDRYYVPMSQAAEREIMFQLRRVPNRDRHTALYMTDVHLEASRKVLSTRFAATIDEINAASEQPAFVLAGGDICLQADVGSKYVQAMSRLRVPVRHGFGNHEMLDAQPEPRRKFHELFGPTYYSFDCGQVHYVVIEGCASNPQGEGWKNVIGEVGARELAWLQEDLRHVPKGMPTVCAIHTPLASTYPERRGTKAADAPWWVVRNSREVINVLKEFNVPLVLQGHMHENERIRLGAIEFAETVSVCGSWWRASEGPETGVSHEPRGYRIVSADGTRVTHHCISSAESHTDLPGAFVGLDGDRLAKGRDLVVNFFDASNEAKVFGQVGDGPRQAWLPATVAGAVDGLTAAHHWKCPADMRTSGSHDVTVICTDFGRTDALLRQRIVLG